jgi:hypothetical protein
MLGQLHTAGIIRPGQINQVYRTTYDGTTGFSVEVTIIGLPNTVIHSHCHGDGRPKADSDATHWKAKGVKYDLGKSHPIPDVVRAAYVRAFTNEIKQAGIDARLIKK